MIPRLVVSATRGGLGKTTIATGIIAAWRSKGLNVSAFKKGPDFIDAGWLGAAAGRPCYNLDLFMMDSASVARSFRLHASGTDAAVIEGNRGLFDGVDETGSYSTARLAKLLKTPVVLIVDCTKATGTVGAMVLGCREYDPEVDIKAVILNNVSSLRHEEVVRKSIKRAVDVPVAGAVPRLRHSEFPERHMGLTPFQEHPDVEGAIAASKALAEKHLDLDVLWNIISDAPHLEDLSSVVKAEMVIHGGDERPSVGVIRDAAFQFYYPDNLEALERLGARIVEINALNDKAVPEIDALYIGGGFPETNAAELARNVSFCESLKAAADDGLPIYAECGGLIYMGRSLRVGDRTYPMASVFPIDFVLEKRPQAHGYTIAEVERTNPFFDKGVVIRGHEFHYSRIVNINEWHPEMAFTMRRGKGIDGKADGLIYKNALAAYMHIHALGAPQWAEAVLLKARERRALAQGRA